MKNILVMMAIASVVGLSGCGQVSQDELDELKQRQSAQAAKIEAKNDEIEALQARLDALEKPDLDGVRLSDVPSQSEVDGLKRRLDDLESAESDKPVSNVPSSDITSLKARLAVLEDALGSTPAAETVETGQEPVREKPEFTEVDQARVEALIPIMHTDAASADDRNELANLLHKADKNTRDKAVGELKELVKAEPENKFARMALAEAMRSQFQDVGGGMAAGRHATAIKKEVEKAIEIDPEYYDAQHYLALFNVGYPEFMPEFQNADKQLDVVIALQTDMTWESRFGDIYAAFGQWYQKKRMYDEGLAKVQEGLDKAPRHDGLLLRKESLLAAQTAADGE